MQAIKALLADSGLELKEPKVRVLARTQITDEELLDQIYDPDFPSYTKLHNAHVSDGEYLIEFAGRQCYESFHNPAGRNTADYIRNILDHKHYSVLEHVHITFHLSGVSRSLTHDLIRHRHFNYSQLSTRYVDPSKMGVVMPPAFRGDDQLGHEWARSLRGLRERLNVLAFWANAKLGARHAKEKREAVRSLLPHCMETKIVVTGNLRSWYEYLGKRWNTHADAEIQEVSALIANHLKTLYPSVFADVHYISE